MKDLTVEMIESGFDLYDTAILYYMAGKHPRIAIGTMVKALDKAREIELNKFQK